MSFDGKFDRMSSIGASEAAAVLDVDTHRRPRDVAIAKRGGVIVGDEQTPYTRAGNLLEADVVAAYVDQTGADLVEVHETTRHPLYPFLSATPDRLSRDGRTGIEAKVVFSEKSWADWQDGGCPLKYEIQCRHSLRVFPDVERWVLIACRGSLNATEGNPNGTPTIDPSTLVVRTIERRDLVDRWIEARLVCWWIRHVDGAVPVETLRRPSGFAKTARIVLDSLSVSEVSDACRIASEAFWGQGNGSL